MPDPNAVSSGANRGYIDLSSAPGSDISFDTLFPPEGEPAVQPQVAQGTPPQVPPQAPEPFLKAGTSVYMNPEDAARGLEHKDELVAKYRQFLSQNGIDPDELKPVNPPAQPQATRQEPQNGNKYYGRGNVYFDALADAVKRGDREGWERISSQYMDEALNTRLASYAPLMAETARTRAVRLVSQEVPEFANFVGSQEYKKTIDTIPILKEAIQMGENDPNASARLHELYRTAYLVNQGLKNGTATQAQPATQNTPAVPSRPTLTPSTSTPPPPMSSTANWATDKEARKQLIADGNQRGIRDVNWDSVRF